MHQLRLLSLLMAFLTASCAAYGQDISPELPDPQPQPAIDFVVKSFQNHDLVALSEHHTCATEHEFLRALISDAAFREVCRDIVVEFASARYQETLDRYLAGEDVAFRDLALCWRNTSVSPVQTWDSPVYFEFLKTVRELNQDRPADARLRVWASEQPIDWATISTREEHYPYLERSMYPARVTWEKALAKGRKTLLIRGGGHLTRKPATKEGRRGVLQILVEDHGVEAVTIELWSDSGGKLPEVERRLGSWPVPSIATIRGTWMASLSATDFFSFFVQAEDGTWGPPFVGVAIGELFDAYLYVGSTDQIRFADPDPGIFTPEYQAELDRRRTIFGMPDVLDGVGEENEEDER